MGCGSLITDPKYKPGFTAAYLLFVVNMFTLGWLGGLAVSDVNQVWMQICTVVYFGYFLIAIPAFTYSEWLFLLYRNKLELQSLKAL